jgi:hypothetical protein
LYIVSLLGADRQDQMANELRLAVGGVLGDIVLSGKALDVQSQYWFGAWLAHAGLRPNIPETKDRIMPDYLLSVDTLDVAVEVKRLRNLRRLKRRISEAGTQLRRPRWPGIIALDVSACLNGIDRDGSVDADGSLRAQLWESFSATSERVSRYVASLTSAEPFAGVIMTTCFARFVVWDSTEVGLRPHLGFYFGHRTFPRACAGLVARQVERVEQMLLRGLPKMGVERARFEAVPV